MADRDRGTPRNDWVDTTAGGEGDGGTAVGTGSLGGPITDPRVGDVQDPELAEAIAESGRGAAGVGDPRNPGAGLGDTRGGAPGAV